MGLRHYMFCPKHVFFNDSDKFERIQFRPLLTISEGWKGWVAHMFGLNLFFLYPVDFKKKFKEFWVSTTFDHFKRGGKGGSKCFSKMCFLIFWCFKQIWKNFDFRPLLTISKGRKGRWGLGWQCFGQTCFWFMDDSDKFERIEFQPILIISKGSERVGIFQIFGQTLFFLF